MVRPPFSYRTLAALIVLGVLGVVCASLGNWQLNRAAERDAIRASMEQGRSQTPLRLSEATPRQSMAPWRAATVEGVWRPDLTVLLENRNYQGRPGYWVATPMLLPPPAVTAVLVLRGWLPREALAVDDGAQESQAMPSSGAVPAALPVFALSGGMRSVQGELLPHVPRLFDLGTWGAGKHVTRLPESLPRDDGAVPAVQNLELEDYAAATGLTLMPVVLAQTSPGRASGAEDTGGGESSPGSLAIQAEPDQPHQASGLHKPASGPELVRDWPAPSLDSDQNRGYALQWFGFATIAAIAWLVIAWRALRRKHKP